MTYIHQNVPQLRQVESSPSPLANPDFKPNNDDPIPQPYSEMGENLGKSLNWDAKYPVAAPLKDILATIQKYGIDHRSGWKKPLHNLPYRCLSAWPKKITSSLTGDALCYDQFYTSSGVRDAVIQAYYQQKNNNYTFATGKSWPHQTCQQLGISGTLYVPKKGCVAGSSPAIPNSPTPATDWTPVQLAQAVGMSLDQWNKLTPEQKKMIVSNLVREENQSGGWKVPKLPLKGSTILMLAAVGVGVGWLYSKRRG